ncbi:MAG: Sir2 family NAD+-dependent deacetylase [Rhodospirillales bacterium]
MSARALRNIVILTGAGISKESGLKTFRDADGLWAQHRIEEVATPDAFRRDPAKVHDFYNRRREKLANGGIEPNAAHRALAELEQEWPGEVFLVTQNVDNLHEKAGSRNLLHMHGELAKVKCDACGHSVAWLGDLSVEDVCDGCNTPARLRPAVVWFGEMPLEMGRIAMALAECDLFLSIGTSGNVYPAAGFVDEARRNGKAHTVELNLEPSEGASVFHEARYGPATDVVPAYVEEILGDIRGDIRGEIRDDVVTGRMGNGRA